jgi:hypothetical protein
MKTLLLLPVLGLIQPVGFARPCDSSDCPAVSTAPSSAARSAPDAVDSTAKKKSAAPARPNAPKQNHAARPSHLFM